MKLMKPGNKISSFAKKRAQDKANRYKKSVEERKKMIRAQYAAESPLDDVYKARGSVMDRKISRLKSGLMGSRDR